MPVESGNRFRDAMRCDHVRFFREYRADPLKAHYVVILSGRGDALATADVLERIRAFNAMPGVAPVVLFEEEGSPTVISWHTKTPHHLLPYDVSDVVCYQNDIRLDITHNEAQGIVRDIIERVTAMEQKQMESDVYARRKTINTILYLESEWASDALRTFAGEVTPPHKGLSMGGLMSKQSHPVCYLSDPPNRFRDIDGCAAAMPNRTRLATRPGSMKQDDFVNYEDWPPAECPMQSFAEFSREVYMQDDEEEDGNAEHPRVGRTLL